MELNYAYILQSFVNGFLNLWELNIILGMLLGMVLGLVVGILPALGPTMVIVLILPFLFGADPLFALTMLTAIFAVNYTAGSITAILMGIPGATANMATVLDGFAMTKKGQGGRAIGAALGSSAIGGTVAVLFAIIMMPLIYPLVMAMRTPEMFCLILLAMCFISAVTRGSPTKGLMSACLGIVLGFVGFQSSTGAGRWTFGNIYLYDGISIICVMLGLFAFVMLLDMRVSAKPLAPVNLTQANDLRELWEGVKSSARHFSLWFRSTIIGYIVGVIPGIGAETAIWVAYGQAQKTSKHPETFGKGNIEGVIAPESANNAKEGGAFLTTMAFGIPGSMGMAYMLVAFLIVGLTPGPKMVTENADICFAMLQALGITGIIGAVICFFGSAVLLKITRIPPVYLFVTLMPLMLIGAYNANALLTDLWIMLIIGLVGILMYKNRYPFAPAVLGFVLAPFFENYFWLSWNLEGIRMFDSPLCIIFILIAIFVVFYKFFINSCKRLFRLRKGETA